MINVKSRISTVSEIRKKQIKYVVIGVGALFSVILLFCLMGKEESVPGKDKISENAAVYDVTRAVDDKSYWVFKSERKLAEQAEQQAYLLKQIEEIRHTLNKNSENVPSQNDSEQEIAFLRNHIAELEEKLVQQAMPTRNHDVADDYNETAAYTTQLPGAMSMGMTGIFSENIELETSKDNSKGQHIDNYLPANTYVKAVILSGVDVSTGVSTQSHPQPVLLRLIDKGSLPNHMASAIENCRISAGAYGDQSSERAFMRLEKLSCIAPDGHVVETDVEGYVVGEDGKNGVRGKMVIRDGEVLKRGFVGGLLSGLGKATTQAFNTTSIVPISGNGALQGIELFKNAGAQGAGDAFELLARYNIQRAEQYQPVIQISAGRTVEVVFHSGSHLGDKRMKKIEEKQSVQPENDFGEP